MNTQKILILGVVCILTVTAGCAEISGLLSSDTDGDGLTDSEEEEEYGTDPETADTDGDGLDDGAEVNEYDTDPTSADTDGDSLEDGAEINEYGTDPTTADTDEDGLDDDIEVNKYGSDPTNKDSDTDGLEDGPEVNKYGTDPTTADTDEDGLNDATEVDGETNPTTADTDDDGLDDGPEINEYGTDPTTADTDEDGLDDGLEVNKYGSDPTNKDSDTDGLEDGPEVNKYGTDPTTADTDEDGLDDATEVNGETDPLDSDTDSDGLDDGLEESLNTDPTDSDTDGDGLSDGGEVNNNALSDADPLRMDVFLEVGYVSGYKPPTTVLNSAENLYDNAPVTNPDGSRGITLHASYDNSISTDGRVNKDELDQTLMPKHFDHEDDGYHYAVMVGDAWWDGKNVGGVTGGSNGQFISEITYNDSDKVMESDAIAGIFVHELGHSVGIGSNDYKGVDSEKVSYSTYTSVMNYNSPRDAVEYNSGDPFDDWKHIENNIFTPYIKAVP